MGDSTNPLRSRRGAPAIVGLSCLAAAALSLLVRHQTGLSGDEAYYVRIANHPAGPHNFPYAFRIGLPYLVHILPFGHNFSWQLLALLGAGAGGGVLFALLREFEFRPGLCLGLAVGFTVSPTLWVVLLRNGKELDTAIVFVIVLGSLFIVRHNRIGLALTLLVGLTIHEACLFLVPFAYAVWARRPFDKAALRDVAVVGLVPIGLYLYLRSTIVAVGEGYQPGYTGGLIHGRIDVLRDALSHGGWHTEVRRLALAYGPLWVAAPLALRDFSFARRGLVLVAFCVASMTLALDWGRLIFFAAPVFYAAGAHTVKPHKRVAVIMVIALLAVDIGYALYMQVHGVAHGLNSSAPAARGPVS